MLTPHYRLIRALFDRDAEITLELPDGGDITGELVSIRRPTSESADHRPYAVTLWITAGDRDRIETFLIELPD